MHEDFNNLLKRIKPDERVIALYKEVLVTEAANQLGTLNGKISKVRRKLDTIADNRLEAVKKFNADQLTFEGKNELVGSLDEDKAMLNSELKQLEEQQLIRESDIELSLDVMRDVDRQWEFASLINKQGFQNMIFPDGLVYDYELGRFGIKDLSPLYRCIAKQKEPEEPSESFLVAGVGFEPTTLWL